MYGTFVVHATSLNRDGRYGCGEHLNGRLVPVTRVKWSSFSAEIVQMVVVRLIVSAFQMEALLLSPLTKRLFRFIFFPPWFVTWLWLKQKEGKFACGRFSSPSIHPSFSKEQVESLFSPFVSAVVDPLKSSCISSNHNSGSHASNFVTP